MPGRVCTGFKDSDGLDVGCHLVTKEFLIESFPQLLDQNKIPTLWIWGQAGFGELGDGVVVGRSSPVQTVSGGSNWKFIAEKGAAAIKTDGTLWVWGWGSSGRLGTSNGYSRSSPVQTISGGTNWRNVSVGRTHMVATKTDGTLWTWGRNSCGIIGRYVTFGYACCPVQTAVGGNNWRSVSTDSGSNGNGARAVGIKTDGTLWVWGSGGYGALGNNTSTGYTSSAVQTVAGGNNWKLASTNYRNTTAAIKTDGTLWVWGHGEQRSTGALGTDGQGSRSSPVQTVAGGTNWQFVSTGSYIMGAIKTDGTLWAWGYNLFGRLGTNSSVSASSPVQTISGGTNWRTVAFATYTTAAIKTDGTLWTWGRQQLLGTNAYICGLSGRSSPVQTVVGGTNWRRVSGSNWNPNFFALRDLDAD